MALPTKLICFSSALVGSRVVQLYGLSVLKLRFLLEKYILFIKLGSQSDFTESKQQTKRGHRENPNSEFVSELS